MTLTATAPFTTEDQSLGVAYISIILVWCFLTMFPFGGWMLVKRDFEEPLVRPDVEARGQGTGTHWISRVKGMALRRSVNARVTCTNDSGRGIECTVLDKDSKSLSEKIAETSHSNRRLSTSSGVAELDVIRPVRSHASQENTHLQDLSLAATPSLTRHRSLTTSTPVDPLYRRLGKSVLKFLLSLISPPAISCLLSLLIALVPQLKALFVPDVPGVDMPDAPDGLPPLEWILDIANFGGAASVPTGLIVLGASLATLSLRHGLPPW